MKCFEEYDSIGLLMLHIGAADAEIFLDTARSVGYPAYFADNAREISKLMSQ